MSERKVWEMLRDQLGPDDVLFSGQRISARDKDHEIDIGVAFADGGIVIVEVKGSQVWCEDGDWWIDRARHGDQRIHPVKQAREAQYALRAWLDQDPRWGRRTDLRWGHAVVLPYTDVDDDFALLDAQRWQVAGRDDLADLAGVPARRRRPADEQQAAARPRRPVRAAWTRSTVAGCRSGT